MTQPTPERNSWAVSDSSNGVITTEDARLAVSALVQPGSSTVSGAGGIRPSTGEPGLVSAASTPNATVTVQPFQMFMPASRGAGGYVQTMDSVKTIDILGEHPLDPANGRNDLIVAQQSDTQYGDQDSDFVVRHVVGDASGPPDPVPGSPDHVVLARVRIPAGAESITQDMIENLRPRWVVGLGGVVPVRDADERDATASYDGLVAWRQDRNWLEVNDGSAWRVPSAPVCASVDEIRATVTNPATGQLAVSTSDNLVYQYNGSDWVGAIPTGPHEARYNITGNLFQTFPAGTFTKVHFQGGVYTTNDVTPTGAFADTFRLNRPGLWSISVCVRMQQVQGEDFTLSLAITNGATAPSSVRYTGNVQYQRPGSAAMISCATTHRFAAGSSISAEIWINNGTGRYVRDIAETNNITLTWLRP